MLNYTFAELLTVFFHLQQNPYEKLTHNILAKKVKVSRRTIASWFAGDFLPSSPQLIDRLANVLSLTPFQADLLFYSVNPSWVRYGTPSSLLRSTEILKYREEDTSNEINLLQPVHSTTEIESAWSIFFEDEFETNYRRWGVGTKHNGMCNLQRSINEKSYILSLQSLYHLEVFMGGDSNCFAPKIYYMVVHANMLQGDNEDDGYGLMFEEISDECYAILRIREKDRRASVVQTFNGGDKSEVYLKRVLAPSMRPKDTNKLAVLAIEDNHWFYINDSLIGQCRIPRLSYSRLDVGIIAGSHQHVICRFRNFRVYIP